MTVVGILGPFLIGTGPILAVSSLVLSRSSLLILLGLVGAFYWITILIAISILLRGFTSTDPGNLASLSLLLTAVVLQGAARLLQAKGFRLGLGRLNAYAAGQHSTLTKQDAWGVILALGTGQAAAQSLAFFVSWLPFLRNGGTLTPPSSCWNISFFVQAALNSLGFSLVLPAAALLSCTAALQDGGMLSMAGFPAGLHLAAAFLTVLGSTNSAVCVLGTPAMLCLGLASVGLASSSFWRAEDLSRL
ncbi:hypothetical protein F751_3965 [Auxenochlorella protothecoides]|uniref:Uncharacterized protein n=2 Tax=Auxenochlorella protothecoides TaxID=3075 RepID=A0A087SHT1_AUXPR|nr:hypothetical protein F751_3965 [Auxenochlorella protothecoides]KFM25285.1 hypothetical protein F751_3965 [Auxenochlorella protothecoides]RMZ57689.1 hypothetical protein APUTEX25_001889 [Auxenochlorella protothecoides]|eukprot:RMZ57689.1 hypothetical protein APUTEX25_001889 [Auxenochlorella protothecoides]